MKFLTSFGTSGKTEAAWITSSLALNIDEGRNNGACDLIKVIICNEMLWLLCNSSKWDLHNKRENVFFLGCAILRASSSQGRAERSQKLQTVTKHEDPAWILTPFSK